MRAAIGIISWLSCAAGVIAGLLLLSAVLSVSQMVFVRYVLNQSTVWQSEYTSYAILAATFMGAPWTLIRRGHVNVDILQNASGPRMRLWLQAASGIASLIFVVLLGYAAWVFFAEAWVERWRSETVWSVPLWMPVAPMLVGTVLLALQYVAELMRLAVDGPVAAEAVNEVLETQTDLFAEIGTSGKNHRP